MAKFYSSTLQKGSKGDEVKEWQKFLNSQGYSLGVDGDFGDKTYAATTEWQSKNGLGADGIVGDKTWGKAGYTSASTPTATPNAKPLPNSPTYDTSTWDESTKGQAALGDYNSAKDAVNNYGDFSYNENKPGQYQSQWQSQLDSLMNSIMNRDKFSFDLNGDALYQQFKDKYIQQGKLAMADAMGQASAMTGGYGNSYAQSVGQQAYQGQLDNLNDIVPELYAMALDQYNREGQDLYNQYGMVADRENLDYGRYRDLVSDFLTERDFAHSLHQEGYQKILDSLGIAQGDYYNGADMFQSEQSNKNNVAGQQFNDAMSIWGVETDQAWKQAEWDEAARQYANEEAWRQKEWDENNRRYEESKVTPKFEGNFMYDADGNLREGFTTTNTSFFDENGNFKKAAIVSVEENTTTNEVGEKVNGDSGKDVITYNIGGKEVSLRRGYSPYTNTKNPDANNGTFNGYQPDNIGGEKLTKAIDPEKKMPIMDMINGSMEYVYEVKATGKKFIYDAANNTYIEYEDSENTEKPDDTKVPYWKDPNYVDRFDH